MIYVIYGIIALCVIGLLLTVYTTGFKRGVDVGINMTIIYYKTHEKELTDEENYNRFMKEIMRINDKSNLN